MTEKEPMERSTVLVVDDSPDNLALMSELLKDKYKLKMANNGERALKLAQTGTPPDIILLDIMMPVMDGYDICRHLKENKETRDIPVIFLTARIEVGDETKGFELGAVDYITKPISPPVLLARLQTHLQLKRMRDYLKNQNEFLEAEVERRTKEIVAIQKVTIMAMSSLAETRDNDTGNHIRRTQSYVKVLAEKLRKLPRFSHILDDDKTIQMLLESAPLHDIGKVGIPDCILLKPGRLTDEEFAIMKTHCILGRNSIISAEQRLGLELPFLTLAKEMTYSHHEKWDGTGYPEELSGDDIPIPGRLMALADVYDALICKRCYKGPMTHEEAISIIEKGSGSHFDPDIVDAFLDVADQFRKISLVYADKEEE
jgi:putative two-component system response regulator